MHRTPVLGSLLLVAAACAATEQAPRQSAPTASPDEPLIAFMEIGGVT